jgi:hypothetical protein
MSLFYIHVLIPPPPFVDTATRALGQVENRRHRKEMNAKKPQGFETLNFGIDLLVIDFDFDLFS